ncbi:delta8-fatty-acid desaturase [Vigna unguiculata]|uniref:Delta8-fatty-acid desaturase n=1 Tax=Vigna unguiculata TaxID=3917 RepID=A0A4D6M9N9_VIGUN|nr:delta8-fatty-acid desaturase [Vigna unguiculata]
MQEDVVIVRCGPPPCILHSMFVHLLSDAIIGFLWIQSGWIGHDSGHYNIMLNRRLNHAAQILSGTTTRTTLCATTSTSTQIFSTWRWKCLFDGATMVRQRCNKDVGRMGRRTVAEFSKKKKGQCCRVKWFGVF